MAHSILYKADTESPESPTRRTVVLLRPSQKDALEKLSKSRGMSVAEVIRSAIDVFLESDREGLSVEEEGESILEEALEQFDAAMPGLLKDLGRAEQALKKASQEISKL